MQSRKYRFFGILLVLTLLAADSLFGQAMVRVITIEGYRKRFDSPAQDAIQRYRLVDITGNDYNGDGVPDTNPTRPLAVLALFQGGTGRLNLSSSNARVGDPHTVDSLRYHLAAEGFVVASVDAASDFLAHNHDQTATGNNDHGSGLAGHQLPGRLYADLYKQDLEALMNDLRRRFPGYPVFALGTSLGTISAYVAAIELANPPDAIVLAAPLTGIAFTGDLGRTNPHHDRVRVPTLVITHEDDPCVSTKPADARVLATSLTRAPKVDFVLMNGGLRGWGNDSPAGVSGRGCSGLNAHNFFGAEHDLVKEVTAWIKDLLSRP